jgi:5-methylcytosine-specific restriction endonuclease McrA
MASPPGFNWRRWKQLRDAVLARDGWVCWICHGPGATTVDHVLPRHLGGSDAVWNLRAAHFTCNKNKGIAVASTPATSRKW